MEKMLIMGYKSEIEFVSITEPSAKLKSQGIVTPEQYIAYIARVSNPSNQFANDTASKLLNYCLKEQHWSIFEQVDITYEIKTTRDIGRQVLRHGSAKFQEFSQRYATVNLDTTIYKSARLQDIKNRQSSIPLNLAIPEEATKSLEWNKRQKEVLEKADSVYTWALEQGIAKEVARIVLPEGLTPSTMYMKNNLRNWITYCDTRTKNGTQQEHVEVAQLISDDLASRFEFYRHYLEEKNKPSKEQEEIRKLKLQIEDLGDELRDCFAEIRVLNRLSN
jgi:thymidylate synthase (FAD)